MLKTTLEQWRMFKAVVDHGGFNQAAEAIHKSQSTIHHSVHKLEEVIGVQLLETKGRKTLLTQAGQVMLRRASYLLEEASKVEAVAHCLTDQVETQLNIAVDASFPQNELYNVLATVSSQFPFICIQLEETILSGATELLKQGQVQLVLTPFPIPGSFSEEICQVNFIAVAHRDHALHQIDRPLTFEDLKSCRQIVVRDSANDDSIDAGWLGANERWTVSHI